MAIMRQVEELKKVGRNQQGKEQYTKTISKQEKKEEVTEERYKEGKMYD